MVCNTLENLGWFLSSVKQVMKCKKTPSFQVYSFFSNFMDYYSQLALASALCKGVIKKEKREFLIPTSMWWQEKFIYKFHNVLIHVKFLLDLIFWCYWLLWQTFPEPRTSRIRQRRDLGLFLKTREKSGYNWLSRFMLLTDNFVYKICLWKKNITDAIHCELDFSKFLSKQINSVSAKIS